MKTPNPNLLCLLADARTRVNVAEADVSKLIALAADGDRTRFEAELSRVEASALPADELDPYEVHRHNPHLREAMRMAGVTAANVREHGPKFSLGSRVLPNLRKLADATAARESRGPSGAPTFITPTTNATKG